MDKPLSFHLDKTYILRMIQQFFKKFYIVVYICFISCIPSGYCIDEESPLFWPAPPAQIRVNFVKSVYSPRDIGIKPGFFKKLKRAIFGEEKISLNKPVAIAVDSQKTIYVCDAGTPSSVQILMQKEKKYRIITAIHKEELVSPVGVAVSDTGLVFIADSKLNKVFCLDKNGKFQFTVQADKKFLRPTGLAVNKNRLYVVDTLAHSIFIFDLTGNFIGKFGSRGLGNGEFNFPTSITVDKEGRIYVVDTLNFRIQVFDKNNKFLYGIGQVGDSSGSFSRPKGVAVDSFGNIYATDGMFDNIQIFNQRREFLLSIGESGQKDGEFWIPSGIVIDKDNYIYVADAYNQRIQILHYVGND
jgi:sugar lactone lactonase YvrE